jgi:hypothetical protein
MPHEDHVDIVAGAPCAFAAAISARPAAGILDV